MTGFFNINDYGAALTTPCTKAFQAAVDAADAANGTVLVPAGDYTVGTINLKGASLYLQKGARLIGSSDIADYPYIGYRHNEMGDVRSLLWTRERDGVRIFGEGTIDLNGRAFFDRDRRDVPHEGFSNAQIAECTLKIGARPVQPILFLDCRHVAVEGVRIVDAPCWTLCFLHCEDVRILDLDIENDRTIPNNDGMHFCGCNRVTVRGCHIDAGDDCIALSGISDWSRPCENVTISDCVLRSCSKAIAIGYMHSIVRNVTVVNCLIRESNRGVVLMASTGTGLVENVLISNTQFDTRVRAGNWWGNGEPICLMATYHHFEHYRDPAPAHGWSTAIRSVRFQNILCEGENAIGLVGGEGKSIRDVHFDGLSFTLKPSDNLELKGRMIDIAPSVQDARFPDDGQSYWLYARDVADVTFDRLRVGATFGNPPQIYRERADVLVRD